MQRIGHFLFLTACFLTGGIFAALFLALISYLVFSLTFRDKIYPGVKVMRIDFSQQSQTAVENYFSAQSSVFSDIVINISSPQASISANGKELALRLDAKLMATRAFSIGRQTKNPYYNFQQIISAARGQINLPPEIEINKEKLNKAVASIAPKIEKDPVDAIFNFTANIGADNKGRVQAFRPSANGLKIDRDRLIDLIITQAKSDRPNWDFALPTTVISPTIKTSTATDLGIKSLLGEGTSYFYDSIPTRVFNIGLGANKITGSLVGPGEIFSFNNAIGTISAVFGFQPAYVILEGKTVLGDGGGVCQVSTTLYRAVLNAGLPVTDRTAHTYRVGFYEEGGYAPGLDATVYPPNPDFKFKNDTGNWILIQTNFDKANSRLSFDIFGTDDGRQTTITGPFITSTSPPPDPIYQDDPTLPAGVINQTDTAHWGAETYFTRKVVRNNAILINETVHSFYIPWPARYLRGTKI